MSELGSPLRQFSTAVGLRCEGNLGRQTPRLWGKSDQRSNQRSLMNRILRRHNDNLWASTPVSGEQESHEKELSAAMDVRAIVGVAGSGLFNEAAACCYGVGVGVLA